MMFAIVALALVAGVAGIARAAENDPWQKGSNWMSFSAGNAKNTSKDSPPGSLGLAVSYSRFLSPRFGIGATVGHNLVEQRGAASLIEIPMTLDYTIYFRWKTGVSPLLGVGFGGYYRKMYRTGDDQSEFSPGGYVRPRHGSSGRPPHDDWGLEYKPSSVRSDFPKTNPGVRG
jgi:hypothetical protein